MPISRPDSSPTGLAMPGATAPAPLSPAEQFAAKERTVPYQSDNGLWYLKDANGNPYQVSTPAGQQGPNLFQQAGNTVGGFLAPVEQGFNNSHAANTAGQAIAPVLAQGVSVGT